MVMSSILSPESSTVRRTEISQPPLSNHSPEWAILPHCVPICSHREDRSGQHVGLPSVSPSVAVEVPAQAPPLEAELVAWVLLSTLRSQVPSTLKQVPEIPYRPSCWGHANLLTLLQKSSFNVNLHLLSFKGLLTQMVARHRKYWWNFWYFKAGVYFTHWLFLQHILI